MTSLKVLTKQDPVDLEIDDYVVNVIYEKYVVTSVSINEIPMLIVVGSLLTKPRSRSTSS